MFSINGVLQQFYYGRLTYRDVIYRSYGKITDGPKRKAQAVELSARFLELTVKETVALAETSKVVYYDAWNKKVNEESLGDIEQAKLYKHFSFYCAHLPYFHRNRSWYFVANRIPHGGSLLEYGCGAAMLTEWLLKLRPDIDYAVVDIPSRTLEFVRYKLGDRIHIVEAIPGSVAKLEMDFNVITCLDVLEHTSNPLTIAKLLVSHLKRGGYLFIDFLGNKLSSSHGSNLHSAQCERVATIEHFNTHLKPVRRIPITVTDDYWGIYKKDHICS